MEPRYSSSCAHAPHPLSEAHRESCLVAVNAKLRRPASLNSHFNTTETSSTLLPTPHIVPTAGTHLHLHIRPLIPSPLVSSSSTLFLCLFWFVNPHFVLVTYITKQKKVSSGPFPCLMNDPRKIEHVTGDSTVIPVPLIRIPSSDETLLA